METVADAAFCNHCGERLPARCRACDALNPPGSGFCYSCGSPIAAAPRTSAYEPSPSASATPPTYARYDSRQARRGDSYEYAVGEPAGFWIRLAALLIDVVMMFAISFSVYVSGFGIGDPNIGAISYWVDDILVSVAYYAVQWTLWQTTVGKRIFNLYVARTDGSKIGLWRALERYSGYWVSLFTLGVGFLMIAFRQDKRGLHDLMCDTVVVRRRR